MKNKTLILPEVSSFLMIQIFDNTVNALWRSCCIPLDFICLCFLDFPCHFKYCNPWNSWFSMSANNCRRESVYLVVMSAILNIMSANIFLSQIDFIKVLTGDVILVSTLVNPKHKVNLTSHSLWAVSK